MEQTHPQGSQPELSDIDRVTRFLEQPKGPAEENAEPEEQQVAPPATENAEPESPAEPESQTPQDEQLAGDFEIEIIHEGQQVKLSRDEATALARQGFDYTQKTQALAQDRAKVHESLQRLSHIEQIAPQLMGQLAETKALEAELAKYQNVDWVAVASQQGIEAYARGRAEYDRLQDSLNKANQRLQQGFGAAKQQLEQVRQTNLAVEDAKLPNLIPEWRDPAKKEAGKAQLVKYFGEMGVPKEILGEKLTDALSVSIAYKAMQWDSLQKGKKEKVGQLRTAPPVTRPGAAQSQSATADKAKELFLRAQKTGSDADAAAFLATRIK